MSNCRSRLRTTRQDQHLAFETRTNRLLVLFRRPQWHRIDDSVLARAYIADDHQLIARGGQFRFAQKFLRGLDRLVWVSSEVNPHRINAPADRQLAADFSA